jgi:hypothetical protein
MVTTPRAQHPTPPHAAGPPAHPSGYPSAVHPAGHPYTARRGRAGLATLAGVLLVSALAGYLLAHIPSPHDPDDVWVGNLAAPYLVLPALAGACNWRTARTAALAGALAGAGLILGFYDVVGTGLLALRPDAALLMDLPAAATVIGLLARTYERWFAMFVVGRPWGTPWLSIGMIVGLAAGLIGWFWRRSGGLAASALVAAPLVAEAAFHLAAAAGGRRSLPVIGAVGYPATARNLTIWAVEAALGVLLAAFLATRFSPLRPFRTR